MVFITEDLVRKRAEHNNCEISTLEELSLHQCDIERIEQMDKWCRELKILYLQANLIPKIENVSRLKKLEYLNLALNNILDIENLEGCESLTKLDLTVNFIARATSVEKLKANEFLTELYLTGNPCTDYVGYRDYVISALPQLNKLDGVEINRSERIKAIQCFPSLQCEILRQEGNYMQKLATEKAVENNLQTNQGKPGFNKDWYTDPQTAHCENNEIQDESKSKIETEDDFWQKPTKYTPESRLETHRYKEEKRKEKEEYKSKFSNLDDTFKRKIRFRNDEGRLLNINEANLKFTLNEDDEVGEYIFDVACYKHLDTSLIDVDIQPTLVRVTVKGKILQLVLNEEISPDASSTQRSQTTGHLVLILPKAKFVLDGTWTKEKAKKSTMKLNKDKDKPIYEEKSKTKKTNKEENGPIQIIERLEIEAKSKNNIDIYNIVQDLKPQQTLNDLLFSGKKKTISGDKNNVCLQAEEDFIEDLDVPPLM